MIGGIDVRLPTRAGDSSMEVAVRAIRHQWPRAEFEDAVSGERYQHFWQIPFATAKELFVYRDSAAARQWDEEGAVPAAFNTMIHLLSDDDMLTVVVDEETSEMRQLIAAIASVLRDEILQQSPHR
jgi:hypothetical protein